MQAQVGERATGGPSLVAGPPAAITEQVLAFAAMGFTSFNFTLTGPGTREQAERLAHEVIPAVRAALNGVPASAARPADVHLAAKARCRSHSNGSVIELLNVIDPLVNPTAHGASGDAFDVVIPRRLAR
jgi:hypothetical protein